jgi:hypothetical protein
LYFKISRSPGDGCKQATVKKRILLALFPALMLGRAEAQDLLTPDTSQACIYSGTLETEIYLFDPSAAVSGMVEDILHTAGVTANFKLAAANVPVAVAAWVEGKRYLLYSQDYFQKIQDKSVAYGVLSHEIGHHSAEHTFNPDFRMKEELEADRFMGYIMSRLQGITGLSQALDIPDKVLFKYDIAPADRRTAITTGWERSDAYIKSKKNLEYRSPTKAMGHAEALPIPSFPWPPPQCAQRQTLLDNLTVAGKNLDEIDAKLRKALDARGYIQRSYFQTPGGFAIVTQLEQFNTDGTSKTGANRWTDYPVQDDFNGVWDYLKSLVMPRPGNFRIFVFLATDAAYNLAPRKVPKEEAVGWLSIGLNRLPPQIGKMPTTGQHYLDALVYEFEAPQSTKKCSQKCPCIKTGREHVIQSGLYQYLQQQKLANQ